jgi:hypothetical protein
MHSKNIALVVVLAFLTSSCALWPYKKDFDCPVKEGLKCKSLYEISEMADCGLFGPHAKKQNGQNCGCQNNSDSSDNKSLPRQLGTKKLAKGNCCAS